jgi:hypothetical protein
MNILPLLCQLDEVYHDGNLDTYEQTLQTVAQQVHKLLPGFTVAYAEIYTVGSEREPLGSMRHVLLPLPERNGQ